MSALSPMQDAVPPWRHGGHLEGQGRPKYLQPMRADRSCPWKDRGRCDGVCSNNVEAAKGSSAASSTILSKRHGPSGGAKSDIKNKKGRMDHATESNSAADAASAPGSGTATTSIQAPATSMRAITKCKPWHPGHGPKVKKVGSKQKASKPSSISQNSKSDHGVSPVPPTNLRQPAWWYTICIRAIMIVQPIEPASVTQYDR
ncbi:hypothetical protein DFQ26_000153 [Actinomortierella ambigua]|nr:hypothetical protein DFQ26_000153 [Actinomortierella ambigua]